MSLSFQQLEPVCVRDPRTIVDNKRDFAVFKSGSQETWKAWTSTSISTSSIQFSCPPPSGGVFVDRKIYMYLPVRLTFVGKAPTTSRLLTPNRDAPRAHPISGSLETIQMTINNQSVSLNCADVIHALMRYNTDDELLNKDYSLSPNMPDQYQSYDQGFGTIRSPLQNYGDSLDQTVMNRGGFPFNVVQNPLGLGIAPENPTITAVVDIAFTELLHISPLFFGKGNGSGFFNVNSMDFNFNFVGGQNALASRMWSHSTQVGNVVISSAQAVFGGIGGGGGPQGLVNGVQPLLLINYITPQETQVLSPSMAITYPYFDIQRFATDISGVVAGGEGTAYSNNVQLSSIPRRMYIYIRERNNDLYLNPDRPDTYFQIQSVNITWGNKNGLLASATMMDLYKMSSKNGCSMSWTQWSGGPVADPGVGWNPDPVTGNPKVGTCGSVLCVQFGDDIGLDSLDAPGKNVQGNLQIEVRYKNIAPRTINATLYVVPILTGSFTIEGLGRSSTNIGVITSKDILDCQSKPFVNYQDIMDVNGGNFWDSIKNFGSKVNDFLKQHQIVSTILNSPAGKLLDATTGLPIARFAAPIAQHFGYGVNAGVTAGNTVLGGAKLSRKQLKDRIY